ncbi:MAG: LPS export ABC transporter ATP-binding protein, partial [Geminicoccaceae bacterium]|nr:LPS export ABC transporter ATP-binding protein [Geminicoccaceae bacterium]
MDPPAAGAGRSTRPPRDSRVAPAACLEAEGLRKSYAGRTVLRDVGFVIHRGEAVGLLGPNGAGKTTSFYMVTGLVAADAGRILLDGDDVTGLAMHRRARRGIGYLPQEASIFRGLSVADNIMAILEVAEDDKAVRAARLEALLDEFGLLGLRHAMATTLSGGERRRVEIARALAADPRYMLLDEPLAGIDPINVAEIRHMVRHLKDRGLGVLITDHNVRATLGLIDRTYI